MPYLIIDYLLRHIQISQYNIIHQTQNQYVYYGHIAQNFGVNKNYLLFGAIIKALLEERGLTRT